MNEQQTKRFSEALRRLAGDEELLVEMASMVGDDAPVVMQELEQHLARGELTAAAATAHKLKGMYSTFETDTPVAELEELIYCAKTNKYDQANAIFHHCRPQIDQLLAEIVALTKD
jgi:HPt (histidine-containing phosphotransfer) domain-containing protein